MRAVQFSRYGGPEVLEVVEAPDPHPGPGQVRVAVRGASVNAIDWKIRAGLLAGGEPLGAPTGLGHDAAGVVDEVGEGVVGVQVGEEVFGLGSPTYAELALLNNYVMKPPGVSWAVAAAAGVAGETSYRVLQLLEVAAGMTLLVDGGSGGVGSVAVQMAAARGARVIATSSERNHGYLASLGAEPIRYGEGLPDRVRAVAPDGIDAVFDVVGKTPVAELIALVPRPSAVASIANFSAADAGVQVTGGGGDKRAALTETAALLADGRLSIEVRTFPLEQAADAHRESESGHVRGKLVLVP